MNNMSSEADCEFVCSRGLLKRCDVHPRIQRSGTRHLLDYNWTDLKPGCTVYVSSASIATFMASVFPQIPFPFRLVTGDCDLSVPTQVLSEKVVSQLLESDRLLCWYSQNLILPRRHPKLRPLPIGLDYHTMASGDHWWGKQASPVEQEALLKRIRDSAKPIQDRTCCMYSNFHFAFTERQFAFDRRDAIAQIPKDLIHYEPEPVNRETSWNTQSKYAFIASPMGGGLDCHRTWEALVLGGIPVMRSGPLDPLFDGLPVLLVKKWSDITQDLLETTQKDYSARWDSFVWEKLRLDYWMAQITTV